MHSSLYYCICILVKLFVWLFMLVLKYKLLSYRVILSHTAYLPASHYTYLLIPCKSTNLVIYLSTNLLPYLPAYLLTKQPASLLTCQLVFLPNSATVYLTSYLPTYLNTTCLSDGQPFILTANLPTRLSTCKPASQPTCLPTCQGAICLTAQLLDAVRGKVNCRKNDRVWQLPPLQICNQSARGVVWQEPNYMRTDLSERIEKHSMQVREGLRN